MILAAALFLSTCCPRGTFAPKVPEEKVKQAHTKGEAEIIKMSFFSSACKRAGLQETRQTNDRNKGEATYLGVKFGVADLERGSDIHDIVKRREELVNNAHRGETTKVPQLLEGQPSADKGEAQPAGNAGQNQIDECHGHDALEIFAQHTDKTDAK